MNICFRAALVAAMTMGLSSAQEPNVRPGTEFGFFTFQTKCMTCHATPPSSARLCLPPFAR